MLQATPKPGRAAIPRPHGRRLWFLSTVLAFVYFGVARWSLLLAFAHTNASPIWPPSGIALAGLMLLGRHAWPAIWLGAFAANLAAFSDGAVGFSLRAVVMSAAIAVGNTLEAGIGGWLVGRYATSGSFLYKVGDVGRFAGVTALASVASAAIGATTLTVSGAIPHAAVATVVVTWWLGDVTGMLVITPFVIGWLGGTKRPSHLRASELLLFLVTGALAGLTFSGVLDSTSLARPMIFAAVPVLATSAYYFGRRNTTTVALIWSVAAVTGTINARGPFASGPLNDSLILLDTFLALCSVTGLMLATDRRESQLRRRSTFTSLAPSWGALIGCLALTIFAWHVITSDTERRAHDRFAFRFAEIKRQVEERMLAYEQILWGGVGLFEASSAVTRQEWAAYIRAQRLNARFPGIQGVGYAVVIPHEDLERHERTVQAEGFPNYKVHPPSDGPVHTPIIYIEPFNWRNRRAFGYDMHVDQVRREAMALARDTGQSAASGGVRLVQETSRDVQSGFLMYVPHYRRTEANDDPHAALNAPGINTEEARRAQLVGFVYAPFRMNDLLRGILHDELTNISIEIFDDGRVSPATLQYVSKPHDAPADPNYRKPLVHTGTSVFGQHVWAIRATSEPSFEREIDRQKAQIVLFGGATLSLLFFVMVRTLALTRARALELADEMTLALQDAEMRFTSLANAAGEGIVLLDPVGAITSWNPGAAAMFEAPEQAVKGVNWLSLVVERDRGAAIAVWRNLVDDAHENVSRAMAVLGRTRTGREFPLEISLCSWIAKDRRLYGLILRDVSERERAAEFFRSMFDEGPEAIVVATKLGRIVRANARASSLFGYTEEEFVARHIEELLPQTFGSAPDISVANDNDPTRAESNSDVRARRADGSEFPVDVSLSHLKLSSGDLLMATVIDITDRKRAAERLHATLALQSAILDGAATSIIAFGPDGIILSFNRGAERMLGYEEREVVQRATPAILHEPTELAARAEALSHMSGRRYAPDFEVLVSEARAGGTDEDEWTYVRKDGSTLPVILSVTALRGLSGEITGFLGVAVDISERKQREQEVQASLREKETLLKEVYHRVKNNLQVVSSLFNLQLRKLPEGPARESLLEGAARVRAMALVHEKLYQSANLSSIQLGNYIGELCVQLSTAAAAKHRGIELELDLEQVDAGPELAVPLGLLLNELVSNSLKHGFASGQAGTIHVALRREGERRARLEVWDDGAGFAAGATEESSRSLGLRLVRTLSRQVDGVLTLENRPGAYVAVSFSLDGPTQSRKVA